MRIPSNDYRAPGHIRGWKRSRDHALPHARLYILLIEKLFLFNAAINVMPHPSQCGFGVGLAGAIDE